MNSSLQSFESVVLTPAQIDFCAKNIDNFTPDSWHASFAGFAGSDRRFLRISPVNHSGLSTILVLWDSHDKDWQRFIGINKEISSSLQLLPEIYAVDKKHGLILEEDCSQDTLLKICKMDKSTEAIENIYRKVVDALISWHDLDISKIPIISSRALDKEMFLWETSYFASHCVSEFFGLDKLLTADWEMERNRLAEDASALPLTAIHRDFQSENILIHNDKIKFVDYQGARLGAVEYDISSLLFDPYISVIDKQMRYRLLDYYCERSSRSITRYSFHITLFQRLMQALGAYSNLSLHKGKQRYKDYIPTALELLFDRLNNEGLFPYIKYIANECLSRIQEIK